MTRWLAVDGGQSALRLRWGPDGGEGGGPGFAHGAELVRAVIESVRRAAEDAGLATGRRDGRTGVACLGLTGCPADPDQLALVAAGVATVLGVREVRICGDMVTAHVGALPDGHGVVLAAGTGTICLAMGRDGSWHQVDGHGYLLGDAGSAFAIGRAGLAAVQRARDLRGPATALTAEAESGPPGAPGRYADPSRLYGSPTLVDDVARFAPRVLACAASGDIVASSIVRAAVADLVETITTAARRLSGTVPVACVGGLFAAGAQLLDPIRAALAPNMRLVSAAGSPLDGAAQLAVAEQTPAHYRGLISTFRFSS